MENELPQEFSDLKQFFKDLLVSIPDEKRVVLFLDSLDQLSDSNNAHSLRWLPLVLPRNVSDG